MKIANRKSQIKNAFTLVELLVVIAVIGILAALLLSALSAAKERALRLRCLNNLKQFGFVLISYGHDNNDRLPRTHLPGQYPVTGNPPGSTLREETLNLFARSYAFPYLMTWDPGLRLAQVDIERLETDYEYRVISSGDYPIGYTSSLASSVPSDVPVQSQNPTLIPQPIVLGAVVLPAPMPSKRMLMAGPVLSQEPTGTNAALRYSYYYPLPFRLKHPGGTYPFAPGSYMGFLIGASHRDRSGKYPAGDNEVMLDGSARWHKLLEMVPSSFGQSIGAYGDAGEAVGARWW